MNPTIPASALELFGPDVSPSGDWGGVPWGLASAESLPLRGLRSCGVVTFEAAPVYGLLYTSVANIDTDGPGGSPAVDPCWQRQTSLRYADGSSCDSRTFPGVVVSLTLRRYGVSAGDFCMVTRRGVLRSAQVYDFGPRGEEGEDAIFLARALDIIPPDESDHRAAVEGDDADDVVTLVFPGSGPGHAVDAVELIAAAHRLWKQFTGRETTATDAGTGTPASKTSGGTAAGSVGVAVPLALTAVSGIVALVMPVAADAGSPSVTEIGAFVQMIAYGIVIIGGLIGIAVGVKQLRHKPLPRVPIEQPFTIQFAAEYTPRRDFDAAMARKKERLDKLDADVARMSAAHAQLRDDVRHDMRDELGPLTVKIDMRAEDAETQFRSLAGEIGGLKSATTTAAGAQAENRRILDTILQRLPRGGGQG